MRLGVRSGQATEKTIETSKRGASRRGGIVLVADDRLQRGEHKSWQNKTRRDGEYRIKRRISDSDASLWRRTRSIARVLLPWCTWWTRMCRRRPPHRLDRRRHPAPAAHGHNHIIVVRDKGRAAQPHAVRTRRPRRHTRLHSCPTRALDSSVVSKGCAGWRGSNRGLRCTAVAAARCPSARCYAERLALPRRANGRRRTEWLWRTMVVV